jgi:hypothetical protein
MKVIPETCHAITLFFSLLIIPAFKILKCCMHLFIQRTLKWIPFIGEVKHLLY